MNRKLTVWKITLLTLLGVVSITALTVLYRDLLFRDYGNINSAGSDNSISILFVGNSHIFWGKVPSQIHKISKVRGIEVTYKDISSNGAHLSSLKDEAVVELQSKRYDYIVLQDNMRLLPDGIDEFLESVRLLCETARENGVIPVLYNPAVADIIRQKMYFDAYFIASAENNAIFVNASDAWTYAYQTIPGISLYAWDGVHANRAGAFLTACVFAAILFEVHIDEIPDDNLYKGHDALSLAKAAWEFVYP